MDFVHCEISAFEVSILLNVRGHRSVISVSGGTVLVI